MTWPLNGSEAGGDLVLTKTSLFFCVNQVVLMLTRWRLQKGKQRGLFQNKVTFRHNLLAKHTIASPRSSPGNGLFV